MKELKPVYADDMAARNLNDQTVRIHVFLAGQQERDFRRNENTVERVVRWVTRLGGDVDQSDVAGVLARAE